MTQKKMKVVIFCGGRGSRLSEETTTKPKPLIEIGGKPILWHIMKIYSHFGYNDFILCLGYKGDMIKRYFLDYEFNTNDFTLNLKRKEHKIHFEKEKVEDWNITFANTGLNTKTGGRLLKVKKYLGDLFFITYGDGVSDININNLLKHHKKKKGILTTCAVHPSSKFGSVELGHNSLVSNFHEKPELKGYINGGFMVANKSIFDFLKKDVMLYEVFPKLSKHKKIFAYKHNKFWHCMDTMKDVDDLNKLWKKKSPWKVWK